jgi:hypothetical protein
MGPGWYRHGVTPVRTLSAIALAGLGILAAVVAAQLIFGIPMNQLVGDTRSLGDLPLHAGIVSYVGILAWAGAAAICLFSWRLVEPARRTERAFLLRAGLLTAWLCLDDLFELHERAFAGIGVPELVTYGAYAAAAMVHLALSTGTIRKTQWWLLAFALVCFAGSVLADLAIPYPPEDSLLVLSDNGPKLLGILAWSVYHVDAARQLLRGLDNDAPATHA